ncbi:MAG: cation:proton antiporter [Pseudomonadota bacterium]
MAVDAAHGNEVLIKDAIVFLFAAGIVVPVFKALRVPAVVGFILAGLVLGPYGISQFAGQLPAIEYITISEPGAAALFAELGVLFLLFLLGLELSFGRLWELRRAVFGAGGLQAGLSALAITGAALFLGQPLLAAITIGLALALSSTAIVMQLLQENRRAATPVGRTALAVLLFQDILVAPILIFVGFVAAGGDRGLASIIGEALAQGLLAILAIVVIGRFVLSHVFHLAARAGGRDFLMALTLLTVVGAAVITASAGLSLALGAFLAGILLGETEFKHQTEVDLEPFKGLLLGLFFLTVGMSLDLMVIASLWQEVLIGLTGLLVVKFIISALACRLFAGPTHTSVETASFLAPAGEFAFVILAAASAGAIIDGETSTLIAAIAGLSMVLIPVLSRLGGIAGERLEPAADALPSYELNASEKEGHVIIAGFGRVGRTIADLLRAEDADMIALDTDARRVLTQRSAGWNIYLGDASRREILEKSGLEGAALVIVTVDDATSAERMVQTLRGLRADLPILARAQDTDHAARLHEAGATFVIPDAIEAGLQLAGRALESFGYATETVRDLLAAEREGEYRKATEA